MSAHNSLGQFFTVAKYSFFSKPASAWLLLAALCLFAVGIFWRLYFGGQQDALFFQALSLAYCWYIYIASVLITLSGLRKNTNYFFVDDIKNISFFVGFLSSCIIYLLTFIFLVEIDAVGFVVVLTYPVLFLSFSGSWNKWRDISRLSMTGLIPFILCNGYLKLSVLLNTSIVWIALFCLIATVFFVAININYYRMWMNKPRNFNPASDDYTVAQSYYQKRK